MSNLEQYKRELTALPLQYKSIDKEQAIKRVLTAIDALGVNLEKDINEKWEATMPVSGVVGLSLHVLLTYEYFIYKRKDPQIKFNKVVKESAEQNIKKAVSTIKALEKAQKCLWDAIESQPKTLETEFQQGKIKQTWLQAIGSINLDIQFQKELLEKAKETKRVVNSSGPVFLFTQDVAELLLKTISLTPVKATIGRGELSPIVRFLNELTGEDVSQAQNNVAYSYKKKGFIIKE